MRRFLLVFGWLSVIGSVGDGVISLYAIWIIASSGWANPGLEVGPLLEQNLPYLYWVKDVARVVLPSGVVAWIFGLPALAYFPARVAMGRVVGWWALATARAMDGGSSGSVGGSRAAA
jgi:hypothetical protein